MAVYVSGQDTAQSIMCCGYEEFRLVLWECSR